MSNSSSNQVVLGKCRSCGMMVIRMPNGNCPACSRPFSPETEVETYEKSESENVELNMPSALESHYDSGISAIQPDRSIVSKVRTNSSVQKQSTNTRDTRALGIFLLVLAAMGFATIVYLGDSLSEHDRLMMWPELIVKAILGVLGCIGLRWVPCLVFWLALSYLTVVLILSVMSAISGGVEAVRVMPIGGLVFYFGMHFVLVRQAWSIISRPWND